MIKKTIFVGNPAYLSLQDQQLKLKRVGNESNETKRNRSAHSIFNQDCTLIPIEDIGFLVLEDRQITITSGLMDALLENNCAVITCNKEHMPTGLTLPLEGHNTQSERFAAQINSSLPLKKQLWQQTIQAKIRNQGKLLSMLNGVETKNMNTWANNVRSGDPDNLEARAAVYYWRNLFPSLPGFIRGRFEDSPNNLLNYGYAILRACMARALVSSGLLPTFGIHHHNRYNAYCLADDIMEPYRPFVDKIVWQIVEGGKDYDILTTELKKEFLNIPVIDVEINGRKSPLMIATTLTTASLARCFEGLSRKIIFPDIV